MTETLSAASQPHLEDWGTGLSLFNLYTERKNYGQVSNLAAASNDRQRISTADRSPDLHGVPSQCPTSRSGQGGQVQGNWTIWISTGSQWAATSTTAPKGGSLVGWATSQVFSPLLEAMVIRIDPLVWAIITVLGSCQVKPLEDKICITSAAGPQSHWIWMCKLYILNWRRNINFTSADFWIVQHPFIFYQHSDSFQERLLPHRTVWWDKNQGPCHSVPKGPAQDAD